MSALPSVLPFEEPSRREQRQELLKREPRLAWTLRRFFENWFLPSVLRPCNRSDGTISLYGDAIRYWEDITEDPDLADLALDRDDKASIDFVGMLPEWGYSRRGNPRGEKIRIGRLSANPAFLPLSRITARSHAARVATLLQKAGPRFGPRERTAELLPRCPYVPPVKAEFESKPPFELEQARAIAAASGRMDRPVLPEWISTELWWQTRLALFYYTGLRAGTVILLQIGFLQHRRGQLWLKVPGSIVKTGKPIEMPAHPQLAELLLVVTAGRPADELILPEGCGYRNFLDLHVELQAKANLEVGDRQSPHAWRRTHLTQIFRLGLGYGQQLSQQAADHADGRTTRQHYVGPELNKVRLQLPRLFDRLAINERQQRLF